MPRIKIREGAALKVDIDVYVSPSAPLAIGDVMEIEINGKLLSGTLTAVADLPEQDEPQEA